MLSLLRGMNFSIYSPRCYVVAATDAMSGAKAAALEAEKAAVAEAAGGDAAAAGADASSGDVASARELLTVRRSPRKATIAATATSSARRRSPSPTRRARKQHQPHGGGGGGVSAAAAAYSSRVIPRSREVGQPWVSSAATTARALWFATALVFRQALGLLGWMHARQQQRLNLSLVALLMLPGRASPWVPQCPRRQRPDLVLVNGPGTCIPVVAAAWLLRLLGLAVRRQRAWWRPGRCYSDEARDAWLPSRCRLAGSSTSRVLPACTGSPCLVSQRAEPTV